MAGAGREIGSASKDLLLVCYIPSSFSPYIILILIILSIMGLKYAAQSASPTFSAIPSIPRDELADHHQF